MVLSIENNHESFSLSEMYNHNKVRYSLLASVHTYMCEDCFGHSCNKNSKLCYLGDLSQHLNCYERKRCYSSLLALPGVDKSL